MLALAIDYNEYTEEQLLKMPHHEAIEGLTENQQRFCECYIKSKNIKMACIAAGYDGKMYSVGSKLRHSKKCQRYIQWLKVRILRNCMVEAADIIEHYIRIAFADMTDFVEVHPNSIRLKPSSQIDGQLIKSIKSGRDGISIELYDKLKALDFLAKYCADMPKDFKQLIEERKVDIMEHEFELKKKIYDLENGEVKDDGFMEAISKAATTVWEDEINDSDTEKAEDNQEKS